MEKILRNFNKQGGWNKNVPMASSPPRKMGGIKFGPEGGSENFHLDGGTNANGGCQEIL